MRPDPSKKRDSVDSDYQLTKAQIGHIVSCTTDRIIGEAIRLNGRFEEEDVSHAMRLINELRHPVSWRTFVDVGANIGTHTLWALRNGFENAVCVEADVENFKLLRVNQILNGIEHNCRNVLAAVSYENGTGLLELSPLNFGDHRLRFSQGYVRADAYDEGQRQVQEITTKRLDTIVEGIGLSTEDIGLVWIDVQGSEGHVLAGATNLFSSEAPIVIEFWPYGLERAGGYELFRDALFSSRRQIFDLKESVRSKTPQRVDPTKLDDWFLSWSTRECATCAYFTDLLAV